jgi:hypothetical protein
MVQESRVPCTPISTQRNVAWVVDSPVRMYLRVAAVCANGRVGEIVHEGCVQYEVDT